MGREGENLPLARASCLERSAPSAPGLPSLADYSGGRLSFGNERAAPLVFPWPRSIGARADRSGKSASRSACLYATSDRHPEGGNPRAGFRGVVRSATE